MKRLKNILSVIVMSLVLFFLAQPVYAAWTIVPKIIFNSRHYIYYELNCISDGAALTATDIVQYMGSSMKEAAIGSTMMVLDVVPGTGDTAPNTTFAITIYNALGLTVWAEVDISNLGNTMGNSLASDYGQYPTLMNIMKLEIDDIGDAGDVIKLYVLGWTED